MRLRYFLMACLLASGAGLESVAIAQHSDTKIAAKDSAITTKIKTKLATEHITSLARIHVETEDNGVVWLHGTAKTQEAADKAVEIARNTEGVTTVKSDIIVRPAD